MGSATLVDSNICRLCGIESENAVLIFAADDEEPFYFKMNRYLPIQVFDDGRHPRQVCGDCYLSVTATQVFLDRILEGQQIIYNLMQLSPPAMSKPGSLYKTGNPLQQQLVEAGVTPQKRRPGRPRRGEGRPKESKSRPAEPPPPPEMPRCRRPRGRLPARFQNTVVSRELDRVLQEATGDTSVADPPPVAEDHEYRAPCHIRVEVQVAAAKQSATDDASVPESSDMETVGKQQLQLSSQQQPPPTTTSTTPTVNPMTTMAATALAVDIAVSDSVAVSAADGGRESCPPAPTDPPTDGRQTVEAAATTEPESLVPVALGNARRGRRRKLRFQCEVCGKKFLQEGRLKFHRGLHRGVRYECLGCTVRFKRNSELAFHQRETGHTGQGVVEGVDDEVLVDQSRVQCEECPRSFSSQNTLNIHMRQRHNPDKQFTCDVCHKKFGQHGSLKLHQKSHMVRSGPRLSCTDCGKVCNSKTSLTYHMEATHNTSGRLFLCNLCGKSFRHQQLLARHAVVHSTERKFKCLECPSAFKTKSHLANHMVRHTGEKRYGCHLCSQRFAHKTTLDMHLRWHTGEKPHKCTTCKKRFTQLSNLCEHQRIHSGEKPFPCTVCSRAFTTACQLSSHMRCHGGGRQLRCEPCGQSFSSRERWRAHCRLHGPDRPLSCTTCGKQLADKWSLRNHMRTHADKGSFLCDVCCWSFEDAPSLERHRTAHSAGEGAAQSAQPAAPQVASEKLEHLDSAESQVIYVTYQNPADPSTVQLIDGVVTMDGVETVQLSADSEVLLEDAAAGVVQLAANKGLVTAEGTRTLELTTEDGRRIQITLKDDKGDLESAGLADVTSGMASVPAAACASTQEDITVSGGGVQGESVTAVPPEESTAVVVTAQDGRQFRLVTPTGTDPVQFATEYIAGLTTDTGPGYG